MNDPISRAAAIDVIRKCPVKEVTPAYMLINKAEVITELMMLPFAQLEVVRCKDCKHRPTATEADKNIYTGFSVEFPDGICPCQCEDGWYNWYPEDNFYCGKAERKGEL